MRIRLVVALASVLALLGAAQAPAADVVHQEQYWSWTGPQDWIATSGAYGIAISDARGTMGIDYGGSSTLCDGQPDQHFKAARDAIKGNLKRMKIRRNRFQQRDGTFFNTFEFKAKADGRDIRGEIKLAYSSYDGQYCYASGLTKAAPAKGYARSIRKLRQVTDSIAYFGPGLPLDPETGLP